MRAIVGLLLLVTLCAGCAAERSGVNEYVDAQTGVTIRSMASPFIYSRDIYVAAANVGDYISIGAVEVNRMGARQHYLAVVWWGQIEHKRIERVTLTLGGQPREFPLATREPRDLGIGQPPFRPVWGYIGEIWYVVTPADLRALAAAPPDSIELTEGGRGLRYVTFDRADGALRDFIRDIPDAPTSEPPRR
jgi:hypothetical protein